LDKESNTHFKGDIMRQIPRIALLSLSFTAFQTSLYAHVNISQNVYTQNDEDTDLINLLPEKYRKDVTNNIQSAGSNKGQLLSAIKSVNPDYRSGLGFLLAYMPSEDLQNLSADFILDNVNLAYQVKENTPWANTFDEEMFFNYILPYINVNERRDNWRQDFYNRFYDAAVAEGSVEGAVKKLNQFVFDTFNVRYHAYLREKPDQSPYESIEIGYASCTGLSILLADALRAVGIPARLVGTPSWKNGGNHTWVEVWDNGWHYIGAAEPGEYDQTWFTEQAREASIYAVSYKHTAVNFPMVWNYYNKEVYAETVTERYRK